MMALVVSLLVGLGLGSGFWLTWQAAAKPRSNTVRIAAYVSDLSDEAHDVAVAAVKGRATAMPLARLTELSVLARDDKATSNLLARAGSELTASEWRLRRIFATGLAALGGLIVGSAYGLAMQNPAAVLGFALVGAIAGWVLPLWSLRRRVRIRSQYLEEEMAVGLEMLGLCVSAGEDLVAALARVAELGSGPFSQALRDAVAQIALGVPVTTALDATARAVDVPSFSRAIEHLTATLERGTPLVDVLSAQMTDVRDEAKRRLIESAGRNEVLMLVPLVFLILPVTIAFAVFPGLIAIQSGM